MHVSGKYTRERWSPSSLTGHSALVACRCSQSIFLSRSSSRAAPSEAGAVQFGRGEVHHRHLVQCACSEGHTRHRNVAPVCASSQHRGNSSSHGESAKIRERRIGVRARGEDGKKASSGCFHQSARTGDGAVSIGVSGRGVGNTLPASQRGTAGMAGRRIPSDVLISPAITRMVCVTSPTLHGECGRTLC